jgi:hypothetical protein
VPQERGGEIESRRQKSIVATLVPIIIIIFNIFTSNNTPTNEGLRSSLTTFYLKQKVS